MALAFARVREGPSPIPTDHRQRPGNANFQAAVVFAVKFPITYLCPHTHFFSPG
jgi:hypothetical protein